MTCSGLKTTPFLPISRDAKLQVAVGIPTPWAAAVVEAMAHASMPRCRQPPQTTQPQRKIVTNQ